MRDSPKGADLQRHVWEYGRPVPVLSNTSLEVGRRLRQTRVRNLCTTLNTPSELWKPTPARSGNIRPSLRRGRSSPNHARVGSQGLSGARRKSGYAAIMGPWQAAGSSGSTGAGRSPTSWADAPTAGSSPTNCCRTIRGGTGTPPSPGSGLLLGVGPDERDPGRPGRCRQDGHHGRHQRPARAPRRADRPGHTRGLLGTPCASPTRTGPGSSTRQIVLPELLHSSA